MGKYKDQHGISRLRALVEKAKKAGSKIPLEVLDVVAQEIPGYGIVRAAIQALRKDQEMEPFLREEMEEVLLIIQTELEETTSRHKTDMSSDNLASKLFRPVSGFIILVFCIYMTICNAYYRKVDFQAIREGRSYFMQFEPDLLTMWMVILELVIGFYFGGRAALHIVRELSPMLSKNKRL